MMGKELTEVKAICTSVHEGFPGFLGFNPVGRGELFFQDEFHHVDLNDAGGHERKGDGEDEIDIGELPVEGGRGVGEFPEFADHGEAFHDHDDVEEQPHSVAEEHTGVAHPFGEGAELDGDPVVRGEAGRVGSPEKDEPDKGIPREFFRPIQGVPELAQENLQEQDQHEERKQNLADISFKVVQNR